MDQRVRVHVPHEVHVGVPQQLVADEVAHGVVFFVEGEGARVRNLRGGEVCYLAL